MRQYLKFIEKLLKINTQNTQNLAAEPKAEAPRSVPEERPFPSGIGSDARPRTRALATLTRREIWQP